MTATLQTMHHNVRAALRAALITASGIPPVAQRAWENRTFTPTPGVPWIRDKLVFTPTEPAALGPLALTRTKFTYMVDSFLDLDQGTVGGDSRLGALLAVLGAGRDLSYSGQTVHIEKSGGKDGSEDEGWWFVPFTVAGYADVPNVI